MRRPAAVAAAVLLLAGCRKQPPRSAVTAPPSREAVVLRVHELERNNLLNFVEGTTVVSRTAELTLEQSAIRPIDGEWNSNWSQPAGDPVQSIVYAFAGTATIEEVGATTIAGLAAAAKKVSFETSNDGVTWEPLATIAMKAIADPQLAKVTPRHAKFLRFTTLESYGEYATIYAAFAHGSLERQPQADVAGCWEVNGLPAQFSRTGARITGWIGGDHPLFLDGGTTGHFDRFAWASGPQHGLAALNIAPDGRTFSAMKWHEVADPLQFGESWFGKRVPCNAAQPKPEPVPLVWLQKTGGFPVFGLAFDANDQLVESESSSALDEMAAIVKIAQQRLGVISHEFSGTDADNRTRTSKRIDSLRAALAKRGVDVSKLDFMASGSDRPQAAMPSRLIQAVYSTVEIRVVGSR